MSDAETGGSGGLVGRRLREAHFVPGRTLSLRGYVIDATGVGWWCGRMAGTGVFVGREGELSRLQSALAERARLVLVVGDAGIGKTRFVGEGLARATPTGCSRSVVGVCRWRRSCHCCRSRMRWAS